MFYDPVAEEVIDFVGGRADIDAKLVRAIGDPARRFAEDRLRMLRAVRFATALDYQIDKQTWDALVANASSINQISAERIRDELVRIFLSPNRVRGWDLLDASGLMRAILPELEAMKGVLQPEQFHPEGDVFVHTRLMLQLLPAEVSVPLVFAVLFHDVAKPVTATVDKTGRIRFNEHDRIGAEMTDAIMGRLRFAGGEIEATVEMVRQHMVFKDAPKMRVAKLKRFMARPTFVDELELHRADCESSHRMLDNYEFLLRKREEFANEPIIPPPLVRGDDLIALGLKPGPKFGELQKKNVGITVDVQVGDNVYTARYLEARSAGGVQLFLIRGDEFFDRPGMYGERGKPYDDNAARFIFFCKAALELARRLTPQVQILHVHDWAAALVPVYANALGLPFKTVLTIHHVADQGSLRRLDFALTNLPERFFTLRGIEFLGRLNFLKGGILYADRLTTVSEHYRREILTPTGGHGLDGVLRENAHRLSAILDGVDYTRWNPASDRLIPARYDPRRLRGKQICREALLKEVKLEAAPRGPVLGMVTRVVQEKGFKILVPLLDRLLWDDVRLIIIGEGDHAYEPALAVAARKCPDKV